MLIRRLWNRLFTFPDARGHRYSLFAPLRAHRAHTGRQTAAIADKTFVLLLGALPFLLPGLLFLGWAIRSGDADLLRAAAWYVLGATGFLSILGTVLYLLTRWEAGLRRRYLLRAHICAACGYPLANLPPQEDGCTPCPECSAAWRLTPPPRQYGVIAPLPALEEPRSPLHAALQWWRRLTSFPDARGTRWPIGAPAAVLAARLSPAARAGRSAGTLLLVVFFVLLVPGFLAATTTLLLAPLVATEAPSGWLVSPLRWGAALPFGLVLGLTMGLRHHRRRLPAHLRECLASGLCAVCGHPLEDRAPDADGCIDCPDCGAAWRTDQIEQAADLPALTSSAHAP